uniref:Glucuronosyltransferase PGSIP8 n=1 Tax=Kalanchoe fedtschenkoi TaxID=63787 RepID=A0A7N0SZC1_KALFE
MDWSRENRGVSARLAVIVALLCLCSSYEAASFERAAVRSVSAGGSAAPKHRNAYATMMYMGTPRDYEFYVAIRVMMRSLVKLGVDADLVVIASLDVPLAWVRSLEGEDGARVIRVENLNNPYKNQVSPDSRFKLTLNKLYAWSLVEYERVVMLDADNLFLQNTDELFQCGQYCAVFINPCIFHTGLFVLQPSMEVFHNMLHEVEVGRENSDGLDQGFLCSYFPDLLDQPMFHPPGNGTKLNGHFRLPLGYQMDASYFYLKLRWNIPCGPNSVITFPSAPNFKPWYWWSYPVLPLGLSWHENRRQTLGYADELPCLSILSTIYLGIIAAIYLVRFNLSKLFYRQAEKSVFFTQTSLRVVVLCSMLSAYVLPFVLIPTTVHPLMGWTLYLAGAFTLCSVSISVFLLPVLAALTPLMGIIGALLVMANPHYQDGVMRALAIFAYAFCFAPILWTSLKKVSSGLQVALEREGLLHKLPEANSPTGINKLC